MAADRERVYAFFASGDLLCFSQEGKPLWSKKLGPLNNMYGHAASLVIQSGKLILQLDQGEAEAVKSKLYAFDARDGQILWQRPRGVGSSWASPVVIEAAGKAQIITAAVPWVAAYALADGTELWRVEGLNGEITPSPIFAAGLVFAISPSEKLFAIQPDGAGDVTKTKILWSTEENVPDITSPASDGQFLFTLTTPGIMTCFNAADGKKQWEHDFATEFHSSPAIAGWRVYLFGRKGTAIVVEAAAQFKEVFRVEMPDVFDASPAFLDGRIFLRGQSNVWCLGSVEQKLAGK
jgi:outer membrane protein assembly factor BamB